MTHFEYFILGIIFYQVLKMLVMATNDVIVERRKKRFIRTARIKFPDNTSIFLAAIDTSDKRTMAKLLRQLQEYDPEYDDVVS